MGLCGYVRVNILTLLTPRGSQEGMGRWQQEKNMKRRFSVSSSCFLVLTLTVLNFWKFTSYCSLKPLWSGMGGSSAGSYLADPTSPIPSHCALTVVTSTLRVKAKAKNYLNFAGLCESAIRAMWSDSGLLFVHHTWANAVKKSCLCVMFTPGSNGSCPFLSTQPSYAYQQGKNTIQMVKWECKFVFVYSLTS